MKVIILLVICLIAINSLVLENFYIYNKTNTIKEVYNKINKYYKDPDLAINLETELKKIAFRNNFDILIQSDTDLILFSTNKDFLSSIEVAKEKYKTYLEERKNLLYSDAKMTIRKIDDTSNSLNYILLYGKLDNGYSLYIRIPIAPIEESVRISNNTLIVIGIATVIAPMNNIPLEVLHRDWLVMLALTMALLVMAYGFKKKEGRITRIEGMFLIVCYVAYNTYLGMTLTGSL